MLGHYDAGFTLRTYTHVTRQMQQKGRGENGQLHGADSISPTGKQRTGKEAISSPVLFGSFHVFRCIHGA